ncbi:hypothetical protein BDR05DRAFT_948160 [Suillus weaverae]|nr:hypothetical protein BDR05DRAFT_948160 [Suillus weaverae]
MPVVEADSGEHDTTNPQANQRFQAVLKSLNNTSSGGRKQKCTAQATRDYHVHIYKKFALTIPGFSELNTKFEADPDAWTGFRKAMENAANSARCDDTGSLKHNGLQYLLQDPTKDSFNPPILKTHGKAVRGWNHPATARLLCPARDIVEFDKDPNAYTYGLRQIGTEKITAKQWPLMFYDMSLYNPKNKKAGFLRGHAIVQGWRHIFTGPMSALSKDRTCRSSKPTKGKMHNLTEPGPINIMYAAIQMYFVACNAESWTSEVGSMNLEEMYYTAVDLLLGEHAEDQWVEDLLQFWKDEAPGLTQNLLKHWGVASNSVSDSEDDMDNFFSDDNDELIVGGSTRDHESASSGPMGRTTGIANTSAGQAEMAGGTLEDGNMTTRNTGNIDSEDEEEQQQPRHKCRHRLEQDIERECSPLTPPPTSPAPPTSPTPPTSPAPPSPVCQPTPSRGHGHSRSRGGKRSKH